MKDKACRSGETLAELGFQSKRRPSLVRVRIPEVLLNCGWSGGKAQFERPANPALNLYLLENSLVWKDYDVLFNAHGLVGPVQPLNV